MVMVDMDIVMEANHATDMDTGLPQMNTPTRDMVMLTRDMVTPTRDMVMLTKDMDMLTKDMDMPTRDMVMLTKDMDMPTRDMDTLTMRDMDTHTDQGIVAVSGLKLWELRFSSQVPHSSFYI